MILVRLDPNKDATARAVDPPRPQGADPAAQRRGHRTRSTRRTRSAVRGSRCATIKRVLGIDINHVVNVNFRGFREAVNSVGCVYADVDRRYFNDNALAYATINVSPATRRCAARRRWTTCASATRTTTWCAPRASRTSCARPRTRSACAGSSRTARLRAPVRAATRRPTSAAAPRSCACSSWSPSRPAIRSARSTSAPASGPSFVISTQAQLDATVDEFLNAQDSPGPRGSLASTSAERQAARRRPDAAQGAAGAGERQAFRRGPGDRRRRRSVRMPVLFPRAAHAQLGLRRRASHLRRCRTTRAAATRPTGW